MASGENLGVSLTNARPYTESERPGEHFRVKVEYLVQVVVL